MRWSLFFKSLLEDLFSFDSIIHPLSLSLSFHKGTKIAFFPETISPQDLSEDALERHVQAIFKPFIDAGGSVQKVTRRPLKNGRMHYKFLVKTVDENVSEVLAKVGQCVQN